MLGLLVSCMYKMPLYQKIKQHVLKKKKEKEDVSLDLEVKQGKLNRVGLKVKVVILLKLF